MSQTARILVGTDVFFKINSCCRRPPMRRCSCVCSVSNGAAPCTGTHRNGRSQCVGPPAGCSPAPGDMPLPPPLGRASSPRLSGPFHSPCLVTSGWDTWGGKGHGVGGGVGSGSEDCAEASLPHPPGQEQGPGPHSRTALHSSWTETSSLLLHVQLLKPIRPCSRPRLSAHRL